MVYDPSLFESLTKTLKEFVDIGSQVILACTERNSNTFQEFVNSLGKYPIANFVYLAFIIFTLKNLITEDWFFPIALINNMSVLDLSRKLWIETGRRCYPRCQRSSCMQ